MSQSTWWFTPLHETLLKHLKAIAEKAGGNKLFWFATFDQITPQSVLTEPIWREAGKEGLHPLTW